MAEPTATRHLLIHCGAGFSRSPAAVALLLAQAAQAISPGDIAAEVLRPRPTAWPNLRIIELGDSLLDRRGELVEAASRIYRHRLAHQPGLAELMMANGATPLLSTEGRIKYREKPALLPRNKGAAGSAVRSSAGRDGESR
jgi:hypothetical protein